MKSSATDMRQGQILSSTFTFQQQVIKTFLKTILTCNKTFYNFILILSFYSSVDQVSNISNTEKN